MDKDFSTWLTTEMDKLGWTNSELARRASVVPSTVSMVISRQKRPGPDFCNGIARALGIPPERVFREAGLLPPVIIGQEKEEELLTYFRYLDHDDQDRIIAITRTLHEQHAEYRIVKKPKQ